MSIDTAVKRHSALFAYAPIHSRLPLPDGEVSTTDRMTLAWMYGGIAAAVALKVSGYMIMTFAAKKPAIGFAASEPSIGFAAKKPAISFTGG